MNKVQKCDFFKIISAFWKEKQHEANILFSFKLG